MEKKMRHLGHDYSYKKFAHSEVEKVLQRFGSTWDGIKHQDIEELQERYGRNKIMNEKKASRLRLFIKSYITPFTLVLLALATTSSIGISICFLSRMTVAVTLIIFCNFSTALLDLTD